MLLFFVLATFVSDVFGSANNVAEAFVNKPSIKRDFLEWQIKFGTKQRHVSFSLSVSQSVSHTCMC